MGGEREGDGRTLGGGLEGHGCNKRDVRETRAEGTWEEKGGREKRETGERERWERRACVLQIRKSGEGARLVQNLSPRHPDCCALAELAFHRNSNSAVFVDRPTPTMAADGQRRYRPTLHDRLLSLAEDVELVQTLCNTHPQLAPVRQSLLARSFGAHSDARPSLLRVRPRSC